MKMQYFASAQTSAKSFKMSKSSAGKGERKWAFSHAVGGSGTFRMEIWYLPQQIGISSLLSAWWSPSGQRFIGLEEQRCPPRSEGRRRAFAERIMGGTSTCCPQRAGLCAVLLEEGGAAPRGLQEPLTDGSGNWRDGRVPLDLKCTWDFISRYD